MKLPSVTLLIQSAKHTVNRFPLVILSALTGAVLAIVLIHLDYSDTNKTLVAQLLMACSLGLPLFFGLHIFIERVQPAVLYRFLLYIVGITLLVQFFFGVRVFTNIEGQNIYRFLFWSAGMHLFVSVSAFFAEEDLNGFWQFNKLLFLRFLTAGLYSGVLYLGLAGALASVSALFSIHFNSNIYLDLWVIIAGLFNTTFFLGGITEPVGALNSAHDYPKGLKIFTQFVLIPLVTIYLLILYAYVLKIGVKMNLPHGWVANLILAFSVTGILALLLVYPVKDLEENKWIKAYSRFFYFSLVPLLILLFVAIGKRISEYGVTIERYIVAMIGVWLVGITLYFIFSKKKNIIYIPLTLAIILFGSCFGPWGMFKVSEKSQLKRLKTVLTKSGALKNGKITTLSADAADEVNVADQNKVASILDYLEKNHGFSGMYDWLDKDCQQKVFSDSLKSDKYSQLLVIEECIGLHGYADRYGRDDESSGDKSVYISCNKFSEEEGIQLSGYDYLYSFNGYTAQNWSSYADTLDRNVTLLTDNSITVYAKGKLQCKLGTNKVLEAIIPMAKASKHDIVAEPYQMTFDLTNENGNNVKLLIKRMNCSVNDSIVRITYIDGFLLLKNK